MKRLPPKERACKCGNTLTVDRKRDWCTQCGRPVYYTTRDQRFHAVNSVYLTALAVLAFAFIGYVFIEVIASPLLGMH